MENDNMQIGCHTSPRVRLVDISRDYKGFLFEDGRAVVRFLKRKQLLFRCFEFNVAKKIQEKYFRERTIHRVQDFVLRQVLAYPADYGLSKKDMDKLELVAHQRAEGPATSKGVYKASDDDSD